MRRILALPLCALALLGVARQAPAVPNGFADVRVLPNDVLVDPLAVQFVGDGRIFVAEKRGRIYILEPDPQGTDPKVDFIKLQPAFFNIEDEVLNQQDRGLLGFCLDPDFLNNGYIYVTYVVETNPGSPDSTYPYSYSRVERFTVDSQNPNVIDMSTRLTLVGEAWPLGPTSAHRSHTTGTLLFGDDGTLLYAHGDGAHYDGIDSGGRDPQQFLPGRSDPDEDVGAFRSQYHGSLSGKIMRIDPATGDGIPSNPYYDALSPRSDASRIWAEGLRNPYRMTIVPGSGSTNPADANPGKLFIGDVGWERWEEVNVAYGGENFGWPCYEGSGEQTSYQAETPMHSGCPPDGSGMTSPEIEWPHAGISGDSAPIAGFSGNAATGAVWHDSPNFPQPYRTALFFCDYSGSWINVAFYDGLGQISDIENFASGLGGPVDLRVDPASGDLFYVAINTDQIRRIYYDGETGFGVPPETPTGLTALGASGRVTLSWLPNAELDIDGYNVYRQDTPAGPKTLLTQAVVTGTTFVDNGILGQLSNGEVYYYSIEAVDLEQPPLKSPHSAPVAVIPSAKAWEFYVPAFGPTLTLPELPAAFPRIVDVPTNPGSSNYDHWGNANRAPLMRRVPLTADWSMETRFEMTNFTSGTNFHTGLMVQFGTYELYTWGPYRGTNLRLERSGQTNLVNFTQAATTISLRIAKTGTLYSFEYRANDTDPWTVVDTINDPDPVQYLGAMTKTWAVNVPVTVEYQYLAIDELAPFATSSADVTIGPTPLSVQFSSAGSYDPDGDLLTHHWDFGDGQISTEANPMHQYALPGDYPAVLTVRDGSGLEQSAAAIDVTAQGNHMPTATIVAPADGYEYTDASATIQLAGTGSDLEDPSGSLLYDWSVDLHDSTGTTANWIDPPSSSSSSFVPNTVDDGSGVWLDVILTVTDSGGLSDSDTVRVYDRVLPPQAVLDLRAAQADGAAPRTSGSAETPWVDLAGANDAALLGFSSPEAGSGWAGTGSTGDPHRIELNGVEDRLAVPAGAPELTGLSAASVEMWVRTGPDVLSRQYLIEWLETFAPPFPGMTLSVFDGELQLYTGSWQTLTGVQADRWYQLILAKDGDAYRAYVDGALVANGNGAQLGDAVSEVVLGAGTFPGPGLHADHFVGALAEVRIYDFALSPANVGVLWAANSAGYVNAPRIADFSPQSAPNDDVISLDIVGRDFVDGATVRLALAGETDRIASTVQVVSEAQLLADVDVTGALLGDWSLMVENPDGQWDQADSLLSIVLPSTTFLHLAARQADGSSPPIVPGAASPWVDMAGGQLAALVGFAGDSSSGWLGDGSGAEPYRLRFDGVDDVVTITGGSIAELQGVVESTIEVWLRPGSDVNRKQTVFEWVDDHAAPFAGASLVIENGELFARFGSDADRESYGPVGGEWIYCALQQGSVGAIGHRDGVLAFTRLDPNLGDQNSELVLGASTRSGPGSYTEHFEGELAVVRLTAEYLIPPILAQNHVDELPLFTPEPMPTLTLAPSATELSSGATLSVDLLYDDGQLGAGLRGGSFQLLYDPACFDFVAATEGELLASAGTTFFSSNGATPGVVQLDMTLLGGGLPIVTGGRLAVVQLAVKGGAPEGPSALTLNVASMVDVANPPQQLPHVVLDGGVNLDFTLPAGVSALLATPSNGSVQLSWSSPPTDYAGVHAFYRPWETTSPFGYPEYAVAPSWPADLAEARDPGNEWTEVVLGASETTLDLSQAGRTVFSAFFCSVDPAGNLSPVGSAPRLRAPNYRLGDFGELDATGAYVPDFDGAVDAVRDLVVLSKAYALDSSSPNWIAQTDVGPTDTATPVGVPQTDGVIDFEDLMIFAADIPALSKRDATVALGKPADGDDLRLLAGRVQSSGGNGEGHRIDLPLVLEGNLAGTKGLHLQLGFDAEKLRYLGATKASALQRADLRALLFDRVERGVLTLDLVALGAGAALEGDGVLLHLGFELLADLGGELELVEASARGPKGQQLELDASGVGEASLMQAPGAYRLLANVPNPFNPSTILRFETPRAGQVSLRVYDLAGRLVRQIYRGELPAGYHQMEWHGRDDRGAGVASGTYLYELTVPGQRFVKKMMLLK